MRTEEKGYTEQDDRDLAFFHAAKRFLVVKTFKAALLCT
jgi:hypothetical protein